MPELLRLRTSRFVFTVKATSITKQRVQLKNTLAEKVSSKQNLSLKFTPALVLEEPPRLFYDGICSTLSEHSSTVAQSEASLLEPIFFENTTYQIDWIFSSAVDDARLVHHSQAFSDAFIFTPLEEGISQARLTGVINTRNDVGWMRLPLEYVVAGQTYYSQISFEVLPTKMVLHQDLPLMYQSIDHVFPLWRFSLVEKTEQYAAKDQGRGYFPLLWLANFRSLSEQLVQGLKVVTQAPHSRLQSYVSYSKADRLKGRLPYRLEYKVTEDLKSGLRDKRYRVEKKRLSTDTPENRFIKMVVTKSQKNLAYIEKKLRQSNEVYEQQRLSDAFLDELSGWQKPLQQTLNQSFFKEVGAYQESYRASLVLQQKTGYSTVYRVWQELKFYLDVFANQSSISMKSVAEIYEVWCFITLKNILCELGFVLLPTSKNHLTINEFFEYQLKDGFAGAFTFRRADGVVARLAHEPRFTKQGNPVRSYLVNQEPDIVLEVTLPAPSNKRFIWLFDAKYRIKNSNNRFDKEDIDAIDYVPDDAINQMHRYRDALIRITEDKQDTDVANVQKSRPVFGAFALYPGFFKQLSIDNPYAEAINEIGIGAFALLPNSTEQDKKSNAGHYWLQEFLREQIGIASSTTPDYNLDILEERLYVQEAARTPYYGMKQVLYPYLTMTAALGNKAERDSVYFDAFKQGTAKYYHMPTATFNLKFKAHIAKELRFLALSYFDDELEKSKSISKIWPIKSVKIVPRKEITPEHAGKISNSSERYFLFELGKALILTQAIVDVPSDSFRGSMKLTTLAKLDDIKVFGEIEEVYKEALNDVGNNNK